MKTLIINGSPRENGDTARLIRELKTYLHGEVRELSAYYGGISPCIDCRACRRVKGCVISDGMQAVYADDFDNVVIASPVYMSGLPGPMVSLASRFQAYYSAKRFLRDKITLKAKRAALILVGGGDGSPEEAKRLAGWMFKEMNACFDEQHSAMSLHTDCVPADKNEKALADVRKIAEYLND